jgi:ankyrin repeat protein
MVDRWHKMVAGWLEAAEPGQVGDVLRLLRDGVDVDPPDGYRRTALMLAAKGRHIHVVRALVALGADPKAQDSRTWTALTYAVD